MKAKAGESTHRGVVGLGYVFRLAASAVGIRQALTEDHRIWGRENRGPAGAQLRAGGAQGTEAREVTAWGRELKGGPKASHNLHHRVENKGQGRGCQVCIRQNGAPPDRGLTKGGALDSGGPLP